MRCEYGAGKVRSAAPAPGGLAQAVDQLLEWSILMVGSAPVTSELIVVLAQLTPSSLIVTSALARPPEALSLPSELTCRVDSPLTVVIFR
ncbi:hypothetical protein D3C76_1505020 [compost metagenome]